MPQDVSLTPRERERSATPTNPSNLYDLIYFNLYDLIYFNLYGLIYFNLYGLIYSPKCTSDNFNLAVSKLLNICNCNLSSPAPHSSAQAEGEDDGEELGGGYDHQRTYHQVQVAPHQVGELGAAPSGEVGVGLVGPGCTGGVRGAQQEGVV